MFYGTLITPKRSIEPQQYDHGHPVAFGESVIAPSVLDDLDNTLLDEAFDEHPTDDNFGLRSFPTEEY